MTQLGATPGNNPQLNKADEFKILLDELSGKDSNALNNAANKLVELKSKIDTKLKRDIILSTAGQNLNALKQSITTAKNNSELTRRIVLNDLDLLQTSVQDIIFIQAQTHNQAMNIVNFKIGDDVLSIEQEAQGAEEGISGFANTIRWFMLKYKKYELMVRKMFGKTKDKKALQEEEKALRSEEFSILGVKGLRERFQALSRKGKYDIDIRAGAKDQSAFDSLQSEFEKNPNVEMDVFLRLKFVALMAVDSMAKDGTKRETTLFGLLAGKKQPVNEDRETLIGTSGSLVEFSDLTEKYNVSLQGNFLSVQKENGHKYDFAIAGHLIKKDGSVGSPLSFEFTNGEVFTGDPKSMTLVVEGKAYMGAVSHRSVIQLKGENLKNALKTLSEGDTSPLQKLIGGEVTVSGPVAFVFPKIEITTKHV